MKVLGIVNYEVLVLTLPQRSQEYKPLLSFQSSKYFNDHNYVTVEFDENSHPVVRFFLSANNHCFLITMILFPQNCQNSSWLTLQTSCCCAALHTKDSLFFVDVGGSIQREKDSQTSIVGKLFGLFRCSDDDARSLFAAEIFRSRGVLIAINNFFFYN